MDFDELTMFSKCTISEIVSNGNTRRHLHIPVTLRGLRQSTNVAAMVDSGASTAFLSKRFVERNRVLTRALSRPAVLLNIDGTPNRAGNITHTAFLELQIGDHVEMIEFVVTDLGPEDVVLGIQWLRQHNPEIDWKNGTLDFGRCPDQCETEGEDKSPSAEEQGEEGKDKSPPAFERVQANRQTRCQWIREKLTEKDNKVWLVARYTYISEKKDPLWAAAGFTHSQKIAEAEHAKKKT
jgi:hypothetical protein